MLICLDLDGTLISPSMSNQGFHYHDWSVLAGRRQRLAALLTDGHTVGIVTNQASVAFDLVTEDDFSRKMEVVLGALRLPKSTSIMVCFAHPKAAKPVYRDPAEVARRKPSGQMIRELIQRYPDAAAEGVLYVGDQKEDQQAAQDAGVEFKWAWEFFDDVEQPQAAHRSSGLARFDHETLTIVIGEGTISEYRMDLQTCTDSARLLDALLSVAHKPWCTPHIFFDLVLCLEEASQQVHQNNIQNVFCPFGQSREASWNSSEEA